ACMLKLFARDAEPRLFHPHLVLCHLALEFVLPALPPSLDGRLDSRLNSLSHGSPEVRGCQRARGWSKARNVDLNSISHRSSLLTSRRDRKSTRLNSSHVKISYA